MRVLALFFLLALTLGTTGCISMMQDDGEFARAVEQARCLEEARDGKTCADSASHPFYLEAGQVEADAEPNLRELAPENTIPEIHSDVI